MKKIILLILVLVSTQYIHAQGFHFGANISGLSSQIEGDQLRGFNQRGYSFGLIGGYTFTEEHYLVISPQYSHFGANRDDERLPRESNKIAAEVDLTTINVLFAYSYRFSDTWTGDKRYRLTTGLRMHRLLNADTKIIRQGFTGEVMINEEEDLSKFFVSLDVSVGINLSPRFGFELGYNHVLQDILKGQKVNISKLTPFYLSLGMSYYVYK